jgi:hypothetical protein
MRDSAKLSGSVSSVPVFPTFSDSLKNRRATAGLTDCCKKRHRVPPALLFFSKLPCNFQHKSNLRAGDRLESFTSADNGTKFIANERKEIMCILE